MIKVFLLRFQSEFAQHIFFYRILRILYQNLDKFATRLLDWKRIVCTTPVLLIFLRGENPRPRSDGSDDTTIGNQEYNNTSYVCQP